VFRQQEMMWLFVLVAIGVPLLFGLRDWRERRWVMWVWVPVVTTAAIVTFIFFRLTWMRLSWFGGGHRDDNGITLIIALIMLIAVALALIAAVAYLVFCFAFRPRGRGRNLRAMIGAMAVCGAMLTALIVSIYEWTYCCVVFSVNDESDKPVAGVPVEYTAECSDPLLELLGHFEDHGKEITDAKGKIRVNVGKYRKLTAEVWRESHFNIEGSEETIEYLAAYNLLKYRWTENEEIREYFHSDYTAVQQPATEPTEIRVSYASRVGPTNPPLYAWKVEEEIRKARGSGTCSATMKEAMNCMAGEVRAAELIDLYGTVSLPQDSAVLKNILENLFNRNYQLRVRYTNNTRIPNNFTPEEKTTLRILVELFADPNVRTNNPDEQMKMLREALRRREYELGKVLRKKPLDEEAAGFKACGFH